MMSKAMLSACVIGLCAMSAPAQEAATAASSEQALTSLAVESLLHSAQNLYHTPSAPARAGRLVAIANKVAQLAPTDLRAMRLLSDVWQSQDKLAEAAQAAKRQLLANPQDYGVGVRWIRLELAQLNRADQRATFLKGVVDTPTLPAALRAVAATELATILIGQGAQADAREVLDQALELDPLNYAALVNRLDLMDDPTLADRARTVAGLLKGNPRAWWVCQELAGLLGDAGLHREALGYLMHAWRLAEGGKPISENAPITFAADYVSALLDAGMADEAVRQFGPQLDRLAKDDTGQFQSLMIEAYRAAGQEDKAQPLVARTEAVYKNKLSQGELAAEIQGGSAANKMNADLAISLAWFNLLTADKPDEALSYARRAAELGASGDGQRLLLAAAQVAAGQTGGVATLESLVEDYPLAAAVLTEHYFQAGNAEAARKSLLAGLKHPRRNLAYRKLARLAEKHGYEVPPAGQAKDVASVINGVDRSVLQMGVDPGQFIEVFLRPVKAEVELCGPIAVEAVLTNKSDTPVPLGQWGLLDDTMGLKVRVNESQRLTFTSLPVAIWPAPRMLQPKQTLTATVRLDVGPLAAWLANHPLPQMQLEVIGTISPRETREGVVSSLPELPAPKAGIVRRGLLGDWDGIGVPSPDAYNRALADIEKFLTRGEPAQRMRSARAIAALLGWIRETESGDDQVPTELRRVVSKPQLLGLMGQAQQSPLPVVRAELATALNYANLGPSILNQLGAMIEDGSPLVRFRVAELIGASGTEGNMQMVRMYARDPDPMVRLMAQAFLLAADELDPEAPAAPLAPAPTTQPGPTPEG